MSNLEKDFQKEVIKYLKEQKIWHYRTQMGQQSGIPDIIAVYEGMFIGLELKRPDGKGKATQQQLKVLEDITNAGGIARLVSNLDEVKTALKQAFNGRHTFTG